MRTRDEVFQSFGVSPYSAVGVHTDVQRMADRIRELESQLSAVVARETQRESGKSILRGIAAPEVYRG